MVNIIGITGTSRAGKGTFAKFLVDNYHFTHFSSLEFITDWMKTKGIPYVGRIDLINAGNELRRLHKPNVIARTLFALAKYRNVDPVIESIRNPEEATFIKSNEGILIAIDADPVVCYERARNEGDLKDGVTLEEFVRQREYEMNSLEPSHQNIRECMEMADYKILNNGTKVELWNEGKRLMDFIQHGKIERR